MLCVLVPDSIGTRTFRARSSFGTRNDDHSLRHAVCIGLHLLAKLRDSL